MCEAPDGAHYRSSRRNPAQKQSYQCMRNVRNSPTYLKPEILILHACIVELCLLFFELIEMLWLAIKHWPLDLGRARCTPVTLGNEHP